MYIFIVYTSRSTSAPFLVIIFTQSELVVGALLPRASNVISASTQVSVLHVLHFPLLATLPQWACSLGGGVNVQCLTRTGYSARWLRGACVVFEDQA